MSLLKTDQCFLVLFFDNLDAGLSGKYQLQRLCVAGKQRTCLWGSSETLFSRQCWVSGLCFTSLEMSHIGKWPLSFTDVKQESLHIFFICLLTHPASAAGILSQVQHSLSLASASGWNQFIRVSALVMRQPSSELINCTKGRRMCVQISVLKKQKMLNYTLRN